MVIPSNGWIRLSRHQTTVLIHKERHFFMIKMYIKMPYIAYCSWYLYYVCITYSLAAEWTRLCPNQGNQTLPVHSSKCQTFLLNHTGLTTALASVSIRLPSRSLSLGVEKVLHACAFYSAPTNPHSCNMLNPYWCKLKLIWLDHFSWRQFELCKQQTSLYIGLLGFTQTCRHTRYIYLQHMQLHMISLTLSRHMRGILSDTTERQ